MVNVFGKKNFQPKNHDPVPDRVLSQATQQPGSASVGVFGLGAEVCQAPNLNLQNTQPDGDGYRSLSPKLFSSPHSTATGSGQALLLVWPASVIFGLSPGPFAQSRQPPNRPPLILKFTPDSVFLLWLKNWLVGPHFP